MMKLKCDKCPVCKNEMYYEYNDFMTMPLFGIYTEIRGQFCNNEKCSQYLISRGHKRQFERMTKEEYKAHKTKTTGV